MLFFSIDIMFSCLSKKYLKQLLKTLTQIKLDDKILDAMSQSFN